MRSVRNMKSDLESPSKRVQDGYEQWMIGVEMKDPVIGAKVVELPEVEKVLRRLFQVEVRDLLTAQKRVQQAEKTKMDQTKQYMQEVLYMREKTRDFDPCMTDGLDTLENDDVRMFFDAGLSLPPGVRPVLELIIQEKVNDVADRLERKYKNGDAPDRKKVIEAVMNNEKEERESKVTIVEPTITVDKELERKCAEMEKRAESAEAKLAEMEKAFASAETRLNLKEQEVQQLSSELRDTLDVMQAEKDAIAKQYEEELEAGARERAALEELVRNLQNSSTGLESARLTELEGIIEVLERELKKAQAAQGKDESYKLRAKVEEQGNTIRALRAEVESLTTQLAESKLAEATLRQQLEHADRTLVATQKQLLKAVQGAGDGDDENNVPAFASTMAEDLMAKIAEDSMLVHDRLYLDAYKRREKRRQQWEQRAPEIERKWMAAQAVLREEWLGDLLSQRGSGGQVMLEQLKKQAAEAMIDDDPVTRALVVIGRFLFGGGSFAPGGSGNSPGKNRIPGGFGRKSSDKQHATRRVLLKTASSHGSLPAGGIQGEGFWLY
ncbi:unnamed protein product [Amoebophrya sp. A120]|nr:unnamed protein product [Amoebophrya sp. A120]|eukprot:GSA120T00021468001.1